jgi:hypothetical protein
MHLLQDPLGYPVQSSKGSVGGMGSWVRAGIVPCRNRFAIFAGLQAEMHQHTAEVTFGVLLPVPTTSWGSSGAMNSRW